RDTTDQEILEIDIGIEDVNEAPTIVDATARNPGGTLLSPGTVASPGPARVNQSEENKIVLYINLEDLWEDDRDTPDDFEDFGASSSVSWIDILYEGQWDDVIKGRDGETGGGDDLTWGTPGDGATGRTVGTAPADANDELWVVIVEIDRTERNTQGDRGSIRLTAKDDNGLTGTAVIPIVVTDENEAIGENAVTLSGSAREGSSLRVNFNDNRDPDLAGSTLPTLVLYTWETHVDTDGTPGPDTEPGSGTVVKVSTSNDPLTLTQSHVGLYVSVRVTYYETLFGSINSTGVGGTDGQDGGNDVSPRAVSNTPDDGVGHFTITASNNTLTAEVSVVDEDYRGAAALTITRYQWQVSDNGRGGWEDVEEADPDTTTPDVNEALADTTLSLPDGDGKYYRVVVSYAETPGDTSANAPQEEVASHAIQVANIRDTALDAAPPFTAPTITGSPFPGGTLSVEGRGISSVQWQVDSPAPGLIWTNIPGATGDLNITAAHPGSTVRAVVLYDTTTPGESGVTVITLAVDGNDLDGDANTTENGILIGGTRASARPTAVDDHEVTASVAGSGHAARAANNGTVGADAGVTVSVMETVDLASLFQDPDTAASRLSFSAAAAATNSGLPTAATGTGRTAVFQNDAGVLVMEPDGTLAYVSDQLRGHDDNQDDGAGNILRLAITANDSSTQADTGKSANTATVSLRINVAPTSINFHEGDTASGDLTGLIYA
ncbi:MAG: hypothetical protein OXG98_15000, partial [Gemmatimonadetes bacterium]|nr:hypothetical protein [Gemmatimonadota bacterium]